MLRPFGQPCSTCCNMIQQCSCMQHVAFVWPRLNDRRDLIAVWWNAQTIFKQYNTSFHVFVLLYKHEKKSGSWLWPFFFSVLTSRCYTGRFATPIRNACFSHEFAETCCTCCKFLNRFPKLATRCSTANSAKKSSATGCYTIWTIFRATSYHCKSALQIDQCNTTIIAVSTDVSGLTWKWIQEDWLQAQI